MIADKAGSRWAVCYGGTIRN